MERNIFAQKILSGSTGITPIMPNETDSKIGGSDVIYFMLCSSDTNL